jgi:hypothetical protein
MVKPALAALPLSSVGRRANKKQAISCGLWPALALGA